MFVYRVEKADGNGPYQGTASSFIPHVYGIDLQKHPIPHDDMPTNGPPWRSYRFGFRSKAQLRAWFSKLDRELVASRGFQVRRYRVPKNWVLLGGKQVVFNPDVAELSATLDPVSLEPVTT